MSLPVFEEQTVELPQIEEPAERAHLVAADMNVELWHLFACDFVGGQEGIKLLISCAADLGMHVTALCGHRWVPERAPSSAKEVCDPCFEVAQQRMGESE